MSADHYFTLARESRSEVREKSSRFLAHAFPIADEEAFRKRHAELCREHRTARHICHGWVLGHAGERYRSFDAGEPSGSAGKPILRQLQGAGLTHCAIIVVRYFGGTLLGKAGLSHAFAAAAKEALAANAVVRRTVLDAFEVVCGYEVVEEVKRHVQLHDGQVLKADFADRCVLHIALPKSVADDALALWARKGITARPVIGSAGAGP